MQINVGNAMLLAFGVAWAVGFSALSGEAGQNPSVATTTNRLPVAANSGADYGRVQPRPAGVSVFCQLPIQIANWNIVVRPSRCN